MDADKDALYWQLHREFTDEMRRAKWWHIHRRRGTFRSWRQRQAQELSRQAENGVAKYLRGQGYQVSLTTHKTPFDLWVADGQGRAASVEVKISTYRESSKGGRYQATLSQAELIWADLVVFIARNGRDWPFIIPTAAIKPRRNIALWSYCPGDYAGQWSPYLNAWGNLEQALAQKPSQAWQLSLPLGVYQ